MSTHTRVIHDSRHSVWPVSVRGRDRERVCRVPPGSGSAPSSERAEAGARVHLQSKVSVSGNILENKYLLLPVCAYPLPLDGIPHPRPRAPRRRAANGPRRSVDNNLAPWPTFLLSGGGSAEPQRTVVALLIHLLPQSRHAHTRPITSHTTQRGPHVSSGVQTRALP
jgi:hypothetical protein